jgi:dihydrodipicolinate synthase/N-acetylneuraminate lyase
MKLDVISATLTPFDADGKLMLEAIPDYLEYLSASGVDGFLALGTNGEFASLTVGERKKVLEAHLAAASNRAVFTNVGTTSLADMLELTAHAREAGARNVSVLPPYYFPLTEAAFENLVARVADVFGGPVFLYNIPRYTAFPISAPLVERLTKQGLCEGIKDSSQDLDYLRNVLRVGEGLKVYMGSDTTLVEGLAAGVAGVVSGMANTFPELIVGAVRAFEAGMDMSGWQTRILGIRELFARYPYLAATRHALAFRKMNLGPVRAPLTDLSTKEHQELHGELEKLDLLTNLREAPK